MPGIISFHHCYQGVHKQTHLTVVHEHLKWSIHEYGGLALRSLAGIAHPSLKLVCEVSCM